MNSIKLLELREEKQLSQDAVAKILGVTRQAYSRYERGERELGYEALVKLANHFDVSVDYLLGNSTFYYPDNLGSVVMPGSTPVLSQEETQLLDDYRALTPALKKMILETIRTFKQAETASSSHKIS